MRFLDKVRMMLATSVMLAKENKTPEYSNNKKNRMIMSILYKWNDNLRLGKRIDEYFDTHEIKKIMIYGAGELGYQLAKELEGRIEIIAYIDKEIKYSDKYKCILPSDLSNNINGCDAIIVTPVQEFLSIKKSIEKELSKSIAIMSIEDIVFDM